MKFKFDIKQALRELETLVNENSFTLNKKGVDNNAIFIQQYLKDLPLSWTVVKNKRRGNLLIATSINHTTNKPKILISVHLDTVHESDSSYKFSVKNNLAFGPGVSDMKAGLVTIIWLLKNLHENNLLNNITLTLIPDEETGSTTNKEYLHKIYKKQDYAMVFESMHDNFEKPNLVNIVTERKGIAVYSLNVEGKAAHSGITTQKQKRVSANLELAHKIIEIEKLANYKKGTTLNVGVINGGTTVNTIADKAYAEFDVRYKSKYEMKRIIGNISVLESKNHIKGTKTTTVNKVLVPPMTLNKKSFKLLKAVKQTSKELGLDFQTEKRGGGSDGNQIAQFGVGTLDGFGPIGRGGHTKSEQIYIPSLMTSAKVSFYTVYKLQSL